LTRRPESAFSIGWRQRSTSGSISRSKSARVIVICRCLAPSASAVMNGRLMSVVCAVDNSCFAFSDASRSRCNAIGSARRSIPCSVLNVSATCLINSSSKSSPPRCVSPFVLSTSTDSLSTSRIDTSNVPPPRSNTAIFSSAFFSIPYASDAAVGSLMIRATSRPAIWPASFVAWRCASLK